MRQVREIIVVEGRYDKARVLQAVSATVVETDGFGIFNDKEKVRLLRRLGEARGAILFTDPDGAGFVIRNHLKGALQGITVRQAYVPDRFGKERRKRTPSKEGKLGVEGMDSAVILSALEQCGATFEDEPQKAGPNPVPISKADLYALGLSGKPGSEERRQRLLSKLDLPERLTANGLLEVINALMTREELLALMSSENE